MRNGAHRSAGAFARRRFVKRRRAWRRRFFWVFPVVILVPFGVALSIALIVHAPRDGFLMGLSLGAGIGAAMVMYDSPPSYIENWRVGADGEKATDRKLKRLRRRGWTLLNDIQTAHGNIDHVLVGPPGVFLLETKRLSGHVSVQGETLSVRWHEDPDDGYKNDRIAGRVRAAAADLHHQLAGRGVNTWIQGVVVLWADFDQGSIKSENVAWIHGPVLRSRLEAQQPRYSEEALAKLTESVRSALDAIRDVAEREVRPERTAGACEAAPPRLDRPEPA